jgi:hypothetical protein
MVVVQLELWGAQPCFDPALDWGLCNDGGVWDVYDAWAARVDVLVGRWLGWEVRAKKVCNEVDDRDGDVGGAGCVDPCGSEEEVGEDGVAVVG